MHHPFLGWDENARRIAELRISIATEAGHPEYAALPATRQAARDMGAKLWFSGVPCKRGHVAPRWACGGDCAECSRERSREYAERDRAARANTALSSIS